jgi:hypothetical protein
MVQTDWNDLINPEGADVKCIKPNSDGMIIGTITLTEEGEDMWVVEAVINGKTKSFRVETRRNGLKLMREFMEKN